MPELRKVSGREAVRALERLGFRRLLQRGSHTILVRQTLDAVTFKMENMKGTLRHTRYPLTPSLSQGRGEG